LEKIHDDTHRIQPHGLLDSVSDHAAEQGRGQFATVDVRNIGAEHERGFLFAGNFLQQFRLADRELDRIGRGGNESFDARPEILDSGEKATLIEESVVDGDIEAAVGLGVEESVEAITFHRAG
jgi:hypothetical protein